MTGIPGDDTEAVAGETKAAAFNRLAVPRVTRILDQMRVLGNLSDKSRYEYSEEQINKIEAAIRDQLDNTIKLFRGKKKVDGFSFD